MLREFQKIKLCADISMELQNSIQCIKEFLEVNYNSLISGWEFRNNAICYNYTE